LEALWNSIIQRNFCLVDGHKLWKNMFFFGAIPVIVLGHVNAFFMADPNAAHRPEFAPYDYLRIRTKVTALSCVPDTLLTY
jgi:hypothetical protein